MNEGGNDHVFLCIAPAMHAVLTQAREYEKPGGPYRSNNRYPNFALPAG